MTESIPPIFKENITFLDLDPVQLFIYAVILIVELLGLIGVAVGIKYKIRWGKLYLERYVLFWAGGFGAYLIAIFLTKSWDIFAFTIGLIFGILFFGTFFNIINKDVRLIYFQKFGIKRNWCTLKKYMCYKETVDEKLWVAIELNEEGRESFRALMGRIVGRKKIIEIMNNGNAFECNEYALLYLYREFGIDDETGDYGYAIEPNVHHSDVAFLQAYDGFWSQKTIIDLLNDKIVMYQMELFTLAEKFSRNLTAPLFKFFLGEQYPEFERLKLFRDAEADIEMKKLEKDIKKKSQEEEKEFERKFTRVDETKEYVSDEGKFRLD